MITFRVKKLIGAIIVISLSVFLISACSIKQVEDTANGVKDQVETTTNEVKNQVVNITQSEVAKKLQESLQSKVDSLKSTTSNVVKANGQLNWEEFQQVQVAEYVFLDIMGYEFKSTLKANGTVEVLKLNKNTGEKNVYATYKVIFENGQVKLK